jgi:hypothetical protein
MNSATAPELCHTTLKVLTVNAPKNKIAATSSSSISSEVKLDGGVNVPTNITVSAIKEAGGGPVGRLLEQRADPASAVAPPPLGFLTFIGLVDEYDVIVEDDQSVVVADLYSARF